MAIMLADISGLIGLIVFVVIAIVSAVLKRKEEEPFELPPELKPRRDDRPSPPPARRTWEEELRELLEQQRPQPPPTPPPVIWQAPTPAPPALPTTRQRWESEEGESHEVHDAGYHGAAAFKEAESRYSDAASLQQRVAQHLADVTRHPVANTTVTRHEPSADAREIVSLLRNPQTVRRAVLASIVLGPPRALEQ